jgi:hypothetical protein
MLCWKLFLIIIVLKFYNKNLGACSIPLSVAESKIYRHSLFLIREIEREL